MTGKGVSGVIKGRMVALGNAAMMRDINASLGDLEDRANGLRSEGKTAMFIAVDGKMAGLVAVADPIKSTTVERHPRSP